MSGLRRRGSREAPGPEVQLAQLAAGPVGSRPSPACSTRSVVTVRGPLLPGEPRGAPAAHTACVLPSRWLWRSVRGDRQATKQTALYKRRIFILCFQ